MKMQFSYAALLGRIKEQGYTQETLANAANISIGTLSAKLNGKFPFKQTDIQNIADILDIGASEIGRYFFAPAVEKTQHDTRGG